MRLSGIISILSVVMTIILLALFFLIPGFPLIAFLFLPFPSLFCYRQRGEEGYKIYPKVCPNCGKILLEGTEQYCPRCGVHLTSE
ncbi:MAG: Sjogren's syndrome/scleroderma autoantigen 1 family protein [Candidatus Ranarchaeia archaeon]